MSECNNQNGLKSVKNQQMQKEGECRCFSRLLKMIKSIFNMRSSKRSCNQQEKKQNQESGESNKTKENSEDYDKSENSTKGNKKVIKKGTTK